MKVVVIGGTGLIGSKLVQRIKASGCRAVAAAPSTGVNTISGEGLNEALRDAETVVDVSNSPSLETAAAIDFFETAGRNLRRAEISAGIRHHIILSVVGTEHLLQSGYFRAKLAQEHQVQAGPVPYTLIRATQFFECLRVVADAATCGLNVRLPHASFQPVAADDVATAIAEAALSAPTNELIEIAGPDRFFIDELVASVLAYDKDQRRVIPDPEAPYFDVTLKGSCLLPSRNAHLGMTGFERWLAHAPRPAHSALA
jgi:uncharacterized protein YbjT (DUF2867 family)